MEEREETFKTIAQLNMVNPATLIRQYKKHSSGYQDWDQTEHAQQYLLFAKNIGPNLSIDEMNTPRRNSQMETPQSSFLHVFDIH